MNTERNLEIADLALSIGNLATYITAGFPYRVPAGMSDTGLRNRAQFGAIEMTGATPEEAYERNLELLEAFRAANPAVTL